jgi:hypothetical protein
MFASKDVFFKSSGTGPYTISRSVRLRSSASAYLNRTFVTPTSTTIWTWNAWVKRGALTGTFRLFGASTTTYLTFNSSDQLNLTINNVSAATSTAVFRDPASWYHIVYQQNGSAQTIYVNNVSVATGTTAASIFNTAIAHQLGAANTSNYFDGYLTDVFFIDGQALTPSSFGALNATSGVWQPKQYTGTYGNNGFYLKFTSYATAAALGTDSSGNNNTWTVNNISVTAGVTYDAMTDVPMLTSATSANYPVWNPLWTGRTNVPTGGNLNYPASSVGIGTMALSGSSYWEITSTGGTSTVALYSTAASTSQTVTTGLTYGFRFNATTGAFDYTTNGSSFTSIATGLTSGPYFFYVSTAAATTASLNAGQQPFTYTPPTGFVALNTYNLSTPTIANGAAYMAATIYTGNGSTQTIANTVNGVSFQPDFVWFKSRSAVTSNSVYDSVRGVTKELLPDTTGIELTQLTGLTAFNSTGFTTGILAKINANAATFVAWQWYTNGGSSSSNTDGTITSTVSVGATQGVSIVTYTGTLTAGTVGHGLGVTPNMYIVKNRVVPTNNWFVYHSSLPTPTSNSLRLNLTTAQTVTTIWNTAPTSSVFGLAGQNNINGSGITYVAYCFSAVAGFSSFGSYTGNGSADGPFIYLGFRPRWVMIKLYSSTSDWYIWDTSRDTYNVVSATLFSNSTAAETSAASIDSLSNGFKCRSATVVNTSAGTYIYAAFAENPFNYALAR